MSVIRNGQIESLGRSNFDGSNNLIKPVSYATVGGYERVKKTRLLRRYKELLATGMSEETAQNLMLVYLKTGKRSIFQRLIHNCKLDDKVGRL